MPGRLGYCHRVEAEQSHLVSLLAEAGLYFNGVKCLFPSGAKALRIDVGLSGNAPQSSVWLKQDPELVSLGFEPVSMNREMLRSETSPWPERVPRNWIGSRLFVVPVALGNVNPYERRDVYVTGNDSGCSSLLRPRHFPVARTETVEVWSLDRILEVVDMGQFPYIEYLKLDCQGSDLDVLKGSAQSLRQVLAVTVEPENRQYRGSRNSLRAITRFLRSNGLVEVSEYIKQKRRFRGSIAVDDPTFINAELYASHGFPDIHLFQSG